jgi:hypothetical protein
MKDEANSARAQKEKALSRLAGARLTSVQFILNYLILGFDERGALTTLVCLRYISQEINPPSGCLATEMDYAV